MLLDNYISMLIPCAERLIFTAGTVKYLFFLFACNSILFCLIYGFVGMYIGGFLAKMFWPKYDAEF